MFTNLRMVNFKSWKDTGDVHLAPLTVLFGGNSTGKSGLLQMLLLLKLTMEARDRNVVLQTASTTEIKTMFVLVQPTTLHTLTPQRWN